MKIAGRTYRLVSGACIFALLSTQALAAPASGLQDLVGARGAGGESELENRGYVNVSGHPVQGGVVTYWWNRDDRRCVQVTTRDGRYAALDDATRSDCNQRDGNGAGAAVAAVGAAALIGALVAGHRSHHHEDNTHAAAAADEAQFERGYQDALHNAAYHNYDRNDSYARGYEAGVEQRDQNLGHRNGHRGGGYSRSIDVSDLTGARASSADDELRRRGLTSVDGFGSGDTLYGIWYSRETRQCIQVTVSDGRVYDIRDIGTHPACR